MYKTQRYYFTCKQAPDQTWRPEGSEEGCMAKKASEMGSRFFSQHKSTGRRWSHVHRREAGSVPAHGGMKWPHAGAPGSYSSGLSLEGSYTWARGQ